jgi:hypothetical protein
MTCPECHTYPHASRCPYEEPIGKCKNCGDDIYSKQEGAYDQAGVGFFCDLSCALEFNDIKDLEEYEDDMPDIER